MYVVFQGQKKLNEVVLIDEVHFAVLKDIARYGMAQAQINGNYLRENLCKINDFIKGREGQSCRNVKNEKNNALTVFLCQGNNVSA